jgi:hypothetical protein
MESPVCCLSNLLIFFGVLTWLAWASPENFLDYHRTVDPFRRYQSVDDRLIQGQVAVTAAFFVLLIITVISLFIRW